MLFSSNSHWRFQSELCLEEFVWENLGELLNLTGLARQYYLSNQICDILAVDQKGQLTIIELKNTSDRYIIPQLTRYFSAATTEKPFQDQIDYRQPICLIAIAPFFHTHNLIDQEYNRLAFNLYTFTIALNGKNELCFELRDLAAEQRISLEIPLQFYSLICCADAPITASEPISPAPPKSLEKLIESLPAEQQAYVLSIREQLLNFDDSLVEMGRMTRTPYGLRKGKKDIYETKLCAEFIPVASGVLRPRLRLRLPYPKREFGGPGRTYKQEPAKGLTWVEAGHIHQWDATTAIKLLFYFGKGRSHHSYSLDLRSYSNLYQSLTGQKREFHSLSDLIAVALEEWKLQYCMDSHCRTEDRV